MRLISTDTLIAYCMKHKCSSVPIEFIKAEKPIIIRKCGHWEKTESGEFYCPFCKYIPQWDDDKFCGNCGSDMRGENNG